MDRTSDKQRVICICALLAALTLVSLWPVLDNDFINFDDPEYITENPRVTSGLTWDNVVWAFGSRHAGNWHPLTWISHMVDVQLFDVKPKGHHLTNLLLHLVNTWLLFLVLRSMTNSVWPSALVAGLFAVHPLHVESVAWASERKDVLSALFFFLALLAYARHVKAGSPGPDTHSTGFRHTNAWLPRFTTAYCFSVLFFALGLMSKPMLVTFPFVLLLLDFWPLQRLLPPALETAKAKPRVNWATMLEKLPFFALAGAGSLVTFWVQQKQGAVSPLSGLPLECRLSNAIASYLRYVGKAVWPTKLAVFYPHPDTTYPVSNQWPLWQIVAAGLVLVLFSLLVLRLRHSKPYLLTGWFWYVGMLVPVIGLVQVGSQGWADRYTYLPLIGLFVAGVWSIRAAAMFVPNVPALWALSGTAVLAACGILSWSQLHHWRDSIQLFEHTLAVTSKNPTAHFNLGAAWEAEGKFGLAMANYRAALKLDPSYVDVRYNIGHALAAQGKLEEAAAEYRTVLEMKPTHVFAHNNLGNALLGLGKPQEAAKEYEQALRIEPDYAPGHNNLGKVLADEGRFAEASQHFAEALRLKPNYVEAEAGLALMLATQGQYQESLAHWRRVAQSRPENPEVQVNLGNVLTELGQAEQARTAYATAVKLQPDIEQQNQNLAQTLLARGERQAAKARLILASRLNPANPRSHQLLGQMLAQEGDVQGAVRHFEEAVRLRSDAETHYNLAIALVMQGQIERAVSEYRRVLELKANSTEALNDLAWILATDPRNTIRNGLEAVQLAKQACELAGGRQARFSGTLDAAYAEAGDFEKALATAQQTRELALQAGEKEIARAAEERSGLYKLKQPFRQKCLVPGEASAPK